MKQEIKIPPMGESITEATVSTILKPTGSQVEADDEILELETDKVNQVLYAPQTGLITLNVNANDTVKIGQVIGYVEGDGKKGRQPEKAEAGKETKTKFSKEQEGSQKEEAPSEQPSPWQVKEGASARFTKEAFLEGLSTPSEKPSEALKKVTFKEVIPQPAIGGTRRETRRKMSKIRKVIASRLVEAQQTTAMLTTFNEVDLSCVIELRGKYQEQFQKEHKIKLGFMSFFVKAAVSALAAYPELNSYIEGDEIVHREYYDIGIAVATDRGLIVPVVKGCDQLSFAEIESSIEVFARKAREGNLSVDDLQGGGFTITNGGIYGSLFSTPILNSPQSGILGMHKIEKRPIVVDEQIVIRPMMYLAMSYDHRIVDGKEAVSFLVHIKNCLEDPARLLLKV
ncbi:MAG TPA: 2-oxoglutarate dehydrogenase complex dihydrolipoyllysine-residue succinyltransferase [Waddliaceae bacterium]